MQCKFCPNEILAGFRCLDCYLKNITKKVANTYKTVVPDDLHGIADLITPPWTQTFSSSGNATNFNVTSNSTKMGFGLGKNTCDGQDKVQGTRKTVRYIPNDPMCRWRITPVR